MSVRVRRIYDPPEPDDGLRVLVDRLWPRGGDQGGRAPGRVAQGAHPVGEAAHLVPQRRVVRGVPCPYEAEPAAPEAAELLDGLRESVREGPVTLLTARKLPERSHAQVLLELLGG
nr:MULTISPECIES: DUF488 family protein [Streptomyces]